MINPIFTKIAEFFCNNNAKLADFILKDLTAIKKPHFSTGLFTR